MKGDLPAHGAAPTAPAESELTPGSGGRAIRGGAIRVTGYVGGVLVSLGAATILVRHLGIAGFGRYATVTSLIAIVGGVTEAGISLYGIREFHAREDADRRTLLANLLGMRLALTFAGIACATAFALIVGYSRVLLLGALVAGGGLLVQVTADVVSIPLQAQLRLARLTLVDLGRRLVALALLTRLARSSFRLRASFDLRTWRGLFRESLPPAVAVSIGAVYFYVTILVMSVIASATQTGLFATSFRVTQVALGVPILLLTAIFPVISREGADEGSDVGRIFGKVLEVAAICGVWMSLSMALGASFILEVVAGKQGHGAVSVLRIQAAVLTVSFISASSALTLISLRRYRPMIVATSCTLILNVALDLAFIPGLDARGGALADLIAEAVAAVALTAIAVRALPRHRASAAIVAPLLLATVAAGAVVFLPIGSVAHVVAATLVYFGVLMLTRSVPVELLRAARVAAGAARRAPG
jgi:O-antigen/teichoic acid export membrane protein